MVSWRYIRRWSGLRKSYTARKVSWGFDCPPDSIFFLFSFRSFCFCFLCFVFVLLPYFAYCLDSILLPLIPPHHSFTRCCDKLISTEPNNGYTSCRVDDLSTQSSQDVKMSRCTGQDVDMELHVELLSCWLVKKERWHSRLKLRKECTGKFMWECIVWAIIGGETKSGGQVYIQGYTV